MAWQVNKYDTVAAHTAKEAYEWYTTDSEYVGEECYPLDEIAEVDLETKIKFDIYDEDSKETITIGGLIESMFYDKPYVICSTEW